MDIDYRLSLNVLKALGGNTDVSYESVEDIWDAINSIYDNAGDRLDIEALILDIKDNGLYEYYPNEDADAYSPVRLKVDVPQKYTDEYIEEIKTSVYQEGYIEGSTDGYTDGYADGLDDGITEQKGLLEEITIKNNGVYEKEDGWDKVTVEVQGGITDEELEQMISDATQSGYNEGYSVGVDTQKSKLSSTIIKSNGNFTNEDGWNDVTVEVEQADLRDLVVEIKENKEYEFLPVDYDGWKKVNLTVSVSGGESGKPKIPNGFRLTESDTAHIAHTRLNEIDFSQYDWSDVYDMSGFFAGFKSDIGASIGWSGPDFNNFIENFNGKMLSMRYMFNSSGYTSLLILPNFGSLTNGCQDMGLLCDGATKLIGTSNIGSWDTSSVLITQGMFRGCSKLTSVTLFDTSKVLDARDMFYGCYKLTTIPEFNTSNMRNIARMFYNCTALTSIPNLDFSNVGDIGQLFYGCSKLTTIPNMNFRYVSQFTGNDSTSSSNSWINGCTTLQSIGVIDSDNVSNLNYAFGGAANSNIINFGGFRNLGKKYNVTNTNTNYGFLLAPNLTYESLLNVINELYDRASVGYPVLTLKMHSNHMTLLSEGDIARATAKGWTLSA